MHSKTKFRTCPSYLYISFMSAALTCVACDEPDEEKEADSSNSMVDEPKNESDPEAPKDEMDPDVPKDETDPDVPKDETDPDMPKDPTPSCEDGATQEGSTSCGLNGRGSLTQVCTEQEWQDGSDCNDPDLCEDDEERTVDCPDGISESTDLCVDGQWQLGMCRLKQTIRVSVSSDGTAADLQASSARLSANGSTVIFHSAATNLTQGDLNTKADIFAHDLITRETELVSLTEDGTAGVAASDNAFVSADGNKVLFSSPSNFLGAGELHGQTHLYLKNRSTGTVTLVTQSTGGDPADSAPADPELSADGRYAVFRSSATNLTPGESNTTSSIFVRDIEGSTTTCVSRTHQGEISPYGGSRPRISADSSTILFYSRGVSLVPGDSNGKADAFITNLDASSTQRVSLSEGDLQLPGGSASSAVSADGRYVTFFYAGPGVVNSPVVPDGITQLYLRDTVLNTTVLVSQSSAGEASNVNSTIFSEVSPDGRYVLFVNEGTNLVTGDTNGSQDLFLRDVQSGTTTRLSLAHDGGETNGHVWMTPGAVSWETRRVVVSSNATNLIADDTEGVTDAFVLQIP